jgi:hypothetical protein
MATRRRQRTYDHRLRQLVRDTGDISIATGIGVPRSTASGWLRRPKAVVVTSPSVDSDRGDLRAEVLRLRRRIVKLTALLRIVFAFVNGCATRLDYDRVLDEPRRRFIRAVDRSRRHIRVRKALQVVGLSMTRYLAWKRASRLCELDDGPSCPKSAPHRLAPDEVRTIHDMVTASDFRHVPTGTLAVLAQRMGRVFASASTWYRLVRERGWRRPRLRIYPMKPKIGIRALMPDQIWASTRP